MSISRKIIFEDSPVSRSMTGFASDELAGFALLALAVGAVLYDTKPDIQELGRQAQAQASHIIKTVSERSIAPGRENPVTLWQNVTGEPLSVAASRTGMPSVAGHHVDWATSIRENLTSCFAVSHTPKTVTECAAGMNAVAAFHSVSLTEEEQEEIRNGAKELTTQVATLTADMN